MDVEEVFNNACHNAILDYAKWERIDKKYPEDIHSLILSAHDVIDAATALLHKYSREDKFIDLRE